MTATGTSTSDQVRTAHHAAKSSCCLAAAYILRSAIPVLQIAAGRTEAVHSHVLEPAGFEPVELAPALVGTGKPRIRHCCSIAIADAANARGEEPRIRCQSSAGGFELLTCRLL